MSTTAMTDEKLMYLAGSSITRLIGRPARAAERLTLAIKACQAITELRNRIELEVALEDLERRSRSTCAFLRPQAE